VVGLPLATVKVVLSFAPIFEVVLVGLLSLLPRQY
jgi:hypothetical protein